MQGIEQFGVCRDERVYQYLEMQCVEQFGVCRDKRVYQYLGMQHVEQFGVCRDERVCRHPGISWLVRARELCEEGGGPGLTFPIPLFPRP